jgi:hypothetical protein
MAAPRLFLPFATKGKQIELRAIEIKTEYDFGPYDAVSPIELADRMGVGIVDAVPFFDSLPERLRMTLLENGSRSWSAGSITARGELYVLPNPTHSEARRSPTLLEELVHQALGHPKSQLIEQDGVVIRTCQHDVEDEAYCVATALLMPYRELFNHLNAGRRLVDLPVPAPVSDECRTFRVKRAGLWKLHTARQRRAS